MKKGIIYMSVLMLFLGCGGGSSSDSDVEQVGDKFIKIFAVANKAVPVELDRKRFDFDKYNDLSAYVNSLRNSIVCETGSINFNILSEDNKCGEYEIIADNCYINGKLFFDGKGKITLKNIANIGCYLDEIDSESDIKLSKNILGSDKILTYKTGFTKLYTGDDAYEYNIVGNGQLIVDGITYTLSNFNVYISPINEFVYNGGDVSDGEYTLHFTDLGDKTTVFNNSVTNSGNEIFTVNSKYYGIINSADNKVYVEDANDNKISNNYNFLDVYDVFDD